MLNSAIASVIARYLKQCTVPTDSPDAHRVERFYHVWCFMRVELEFGSLAAAFSRNGGTYARTVASGGSVESAATPTPARPLMAWWEAADQPGSAALGRMGGRDCYCVPAEGGVVWRGVGFRRERGRWSRAAYLRYVWQTTNCGGKIIVKKNCGGKIIFYSNM
jgi:hypothetical protein